MRNDSDALDSHYGISLRCIDDLQLMELATRSGPRTRLNGLARCIRNHSGISSAQLERARDVKEAGTKLFLPDKGGGYEVFNQRPLEPIVQEYCILDVVHMPALWNAYRRRVPPFWKMMVKEAGEERVRESQEAGYEPNGEHKMYGCWEESMIRNAHKKWKKGKRTGLCS